ncbi:hypothetical protein MTR_7g006350 [Medicago truncatula]|uniref:Uncharacterized protein n=1 Tax=Medicago truncatula TaxID=3880 RepID=G7KXP3_MEDTR|nr:hypothetical protein MTR_7g006350 [Medicago truncatula]
MPVSNSVKKLIYVRIEIFYIKLNNDDVCKGGEDCSSCDGLFLNFEGRWLKGYVRKIEVCDAFHVEF